MDRSSWIGHLGSLNLARSSWSDHRGSVILDRSTLIDHFGSLIVHRAIVVGRAPPIGTVGACALGSCLSMFLSWLCLMRQRVISTPSKSTRVEKSIRDFDLKATERQSGGSILEIILN